MNESAAFAGGDVDDSLHASANDSAADTADGRAPRVLIIIPAYNEQGTIAEVIRKLRLFGPDHDLLVINDGSQDETSAAARRTGAARVIDLPVNVGIGGAMQTGYLYADRHGYDIAVQFDGDGQHEAAELERLLAVIVRDEADCCIGSRFRETSSYRSTALRRIGIAFFSRMIQWMTGQRITDPTSGFRAVNRTVIRQFARSYPHDYPEVEAIMQLLRRGGRIREVAVRMHGRQSGKSSITPLRSLYYMIKVSLAVIMTSLRDVR